MGNEEEKPEITTMRVKSEDLSNARLPEFRLFVGKKVGRVANTDAELFHDMVAFVIREASIEIVKKQGTN